MDYRTATREERAAEFIDFATRLHDGRYDYTNVERNYVNGDTKVTIVCPDHGPFEQTPREHRRVRETPWGPQRGQGCRDCKGFNANVELRRERFIAKAVDIHGRRYDYNEVVYVDAKTDVTVLCAEHGQFSVRPDNHTYKHPAGCPDCALAGHRAAKRSKKTNQKGQWRTRPVGATTGRKRPPRSRTAN
ncbi:hypothetical protein [Curtobacterium sp. PsM8]|uniref:hypothetical protein n=1 Tax=Curtobacterium sp. PsM8 TaxID=3030532 RepID=UPI00263B7B4F|nr:hypothetical protein [Curtobacterium sp. PsM8]MDN4647247.1 hypothetical protein [Curtobacterium sp. PsM8]